MTEIKSNNIIIIIIIIEKLNSQAQMKTCEHTKSVRRINRCNSGHNLTWWTFHTLVFLCLLIRDYKEWNKAKRAAVELPTGLWFVSFMLSKRRPKCLQGCGEFSSSVSSKPEHSGSKKEKEKTARKELELESKAGDRVDMREASSPTNRDNEESNYKTVGDPK